MTRLRLAELLWERYPGHKWEQLLLRGRFSQQKRLEKTVGSLFEVCLLIFLSCYPTNWFFLYQGHQIKINARHEAGLINPDSGQHFELDIYIPELSLAFEYQVSSSYYYFELFIYSYCLISAGETSLCNF